MEEELLERMAQVDDNGDMQEPQESWDEEDLYIEEDSEEEQTERGGFAAAVKAVFPGGISNQKDKGGRSLNVNTFAETQEQDIPMVTPQVHRQIGSPSARGGRGGGMSRSVQSASGGHSGKKNEGDNVILIGSRKSQITRAEDTDYIAFKRASNMLTREEENVLKQLPEKAKPEMVSTKMYTFIAEIQFNTPISEKGLKMDNSKEYSIPTCFGQWIKRTRTVSPSIIIQPYRQESGGNPITHEDQLPQEDIEGISLYFHNHRVERNGILKGMVRFSITEPWVSLKNQRSPYFKWLANNRIYLRHTSFDADTIVLVGFLPGVHPDAARLLDLTNELSERLNLPAGIDFQLVPRYLTVMDSNQTKVEFKAIAIETDGNMAEKLREKLFKLGDPKVEKHKWPVTGKALFTPMYKTAAWTPDTIAAMARLHLSIITKLEQIFVENVFDIDAELTFREPGGVETKRTLREAIEASTNQEGDEQVVHSVHTTNKSGVIRILVTNQNASQAREFFGNLQVHLRASLSPEDVHRVTEGKQIHVTDRTYESEDSRTYAGYAEAMLRENPQDGNPIMNDHAITSPWRKKTRMDVSYSSAAQGALASRRRSRNTDANPDEEAEDGKADEAEDLGENWEQKIQASFKSLFGDQPPLRAEDMERKMQETINKQTEESEKRLEQRFLKRNEAVYSY